MPTENRSSNTEIKPCPFCGEKAELRCTAGPDPDWFVQCTECRASADVFSEDNLTGWNDRAHPAASDGFSAGDMADQGAKAFASRDGEVHELRAKLAEAQEVLRDCIEVGELDAETQWKAERVSKGRRLYVDDRALASIVDPSEPVVSDQGIPGTSFQRLNTLANQGE
jgi:hypothetical protein